MNTISLEANSSALGTRRGSITVTTARLVATAASTRKSDVYFMVLQGGRSSDVPSPTRFRVPLELLETGKQVYSGNVAAELQTISGTFLMGEGTGQANRVRAGQIRRSRRRACKWYEVNNNRTGGSA